jgi:hypothetical protein
VVVVREIFEGVWNAAGTMSPINMTTATLLSRINVRLSFNHSLQVPLPTLSPTVHDLKQHLAPTVSPSASQHLRILRKGAILKDSTTLAHGDTVCAIFSCSGGSACVDSPLEPHTPLAEQFRNHEYDDDAESSVYSLNSHVGNMKALRRLQCSAPKSASKLFGNRSSLMTSDYADLVLGFTPPKLTAKAAKKSAAATEEQAAGEFQGELAAGQHRGMHAIAAAQHNGTPVITLLQVL